MELQRILVISILLLYSMIMNAQRDSAIVQNPISSSRTINFGVFGGINLYPAGKFTLNNGTHNQESFRTSIAQFGFSIQHSIAPKVDLIYQVEGNTVPTGYVFRLKKEYSDSVYIPFDFEISIVDLSLWQVSFGAGPALKSNIGGKFQNSLAAIVSVSLGYGSVGDRHSEPPPPEQVGSKRDTTLYFGMYQNGVCPFIRFQDKISISAGKFSFGLLGSINFFFKPQVRGEFIFLKNLPNESSGTYHSSLINYSICGVMGYSIHRKNKVYSTDDFD